MSQQSTFYRTISLVAYKTSKISINS